ncbi:GIY-YIG nuclease family protein [Spiroplasma culicicola]|uniref:GIY-YIG domain-containing protein n=1 Tax=Spiroplasma culicicola AES-1 TaxID=1276246 RepID=W6A8J8_9MOLU|nr:GIY-YIG nuclease family protein [Spiroplasma culicicola]AHI53342.1 hypothetical protein SCULI_v1c10020 [Spiroplasma culicicola AES-1]
MSLEFKRKYKYIYKAKVSRDEKYKQASLEYCNKVILEVIKTHTIYDVETIKELGNEIQGVYLIFSLNKKGELKFTYVGESIDILKRWKKHIYNFNIKNKESAKIRKKESKIENLRFTVLKIEPDQNARLKKETYYIYHFKSWYTNINKKYANRKMRCDFGHGVARTYLTYDKNAAKFRLYIYGICRNKICKNKFLID